MSDQPPGPIAFGEAERFEAERATAEAVGVDVTFVQHVLSVFTEQMLDIIDRREAAHRTELGRILDEELARGERR